MCIIAHNFAQHTTSHALLTSLNSKPQCQYLQCGQMETLFHIDAPRNSWINSTVNPKVKSNERIRSWGTFLSSQHFRGKEVCQNFGRGTNTIDKQVNYSHGPPQTKQQVGQCIAKTLLVHEQATNKHELTKFTTAWTWGKPPPYPLQYFLCLAIGLAPKCHFVPRLPSWSPEIP